MIKWKSWKIVLFVAMCVCLNTGGRILSVWLELPLWADSFGTALCAYIGGPLCGAMVGLTGNLAYSLVNRKSGIQCDSSSFCGVFHYQYCPWHNCGHCGATELV